MVGLVFLLKNFGSVVGPMNAICCSVNVDGVQECTYCVDLLHSQVVGTQKPMCPLHQKIIGGLLESP